MYVCKICSKNLYSKITFSNMFKLNYEIHINCIERLQNNVLDVIVPIEGNYVIYDYVFKHIPSEFNENYLWFCNFNKVLMRQIKNSEWSMVIIYDEFIETLMKTNNPYLLLNLTNLPILILSLEEKDMTFLEEL